MELVAVGAAAARDARMDAMSNVPLLAPAAWDARAGTMGTFSVTGL